MATRLILLLLLLAGCTEYRVEKAVVTRSDAHAVECWGQSRTQFELQSGKLASACDAYGEPGDTLWVRLSDKHGIKEAYTRRPDSNTP